MKTVLYQVIQCSISTEFSSIWPIDRALSGATTLGQSGPGSDGNKGVLRIPQSTSITGTSQSYCLVSYLGHSLVQRGSYSSTEVQSEYSTAPADWARELRIYEFKLGHNTAKAIKTFAVWKEKAQLITVQ